MKPNFESVAFHTNLTGDGVTAGNDHGLYAGSVGNLVKVVREGDQINVAQGGGTDLRTVADNGIVFNNIGSGGGEDPLGLAFTDTGFIVYRLRFTDGSNGVFRTQLVPVPEPVGLLAAATAFTLLAFGRWKGRGF